MPCHIHGKVTNSSRHYIVIAFRPLNCTQSKDVSTCHVKTSCYGGIAAPNVLLFLYITMHQPFSAGPITPLNELVNVPVDHAGIMVKVIPGTKAIFCFLNCKY
jgi:hypothetical protein